MATKPIEGIYLFKDNVISIFARTENELLL